MDVRFDRQSLLLDRQRTLIRAAEFHYWRLPDRSLWGEALLRIRAAGYNAVSTCYSWAFHSPRPNEYRFDGLRDVDYFHGLIEDVGLLLIARPGPYIGAETDGGGFPGWLLADATVPLRCRADMQPFASPVYLQAVHQWFSQIIPRILDCENLVAFQLESEYMNAPMADTVGYMEQLYSSVRGFGVGVPLFHNGAHQPGDWQTAVDICGHDVKPFGSNAAEWRAEAPNALRELDALAQRLRPACPYSPLFIPELQAGGADSWGGLGYPALREAWGRDQLGLVVRTALAQQVTMFSHYAFCGGTNWDFLGSPEVYTSYDYAAPVHETLDVTARYAEAKHVATAAGALGGLLMEGTPSDAVMVEPADLKFTEVRHDGELLLCVRNLEVSERAGRIVAPPWQFPIALPPGAARLLTIGAPLSPDWRWAANAEVFTILSGRIVFLVSPPEGTTLQLLGDGRIVESDPSVNVAPGDPRTITTPGEGVHRLLLTDEYGEYAFYILGQDEADRAWRSTIEGLDRVVLGPDLFLNDGGELRAHVRSARTVSIVDLNTLEPGLPTDDYDLPGPEDVSAPTFGPWTVHVGGAELAPEFDDTGWVEVPHTAATAMEQWGIYYGVACYRARYTGVATELTLDARHHASVYLNGTHVASVDWDPPANGPDEEAAVPIALPSGVQSATAENVLAVLTESLGHNKGVAGDDYRNPRGLLGATLDGRALDWRLRAGLTSSAKGDVVGAETSVFVDDWTMHVSGAESPPPLPSGAHLVSYTSELLAPLPADHWGPLEIEIDACPGKAFLVVNGTLIGRFWGARGPQHRFVIPPTWLDAEGRCEVTLIVWTRGEDGPVGPLRAHREPVHRVNVL